MVLDVEVVGLESLARLSSALRAAGDQGKGLKRELRTSLNRETKKTRADMRKAISPALPQSGGLATDVLRSTRFTTQLGSASNPSVAIRARGRRSIRRMNATGMFRHPVFGRRDVWVNQFVPGLAQFLDKPFEASAPELKYAVTQALARVRSQIERSI